ncbi:MAG: insulinase family protein [Cyanobacteria bacterium CRU_2_1]|nr:insulinase family protein [Cyanobacteria bacterium RU_5_0]NJR58454.1 insulinase family protein [Cyanobacteria bacterium CRU_2_1]
MHYLNPLAAHRQARSLCHLFRLDRFRLDRVSWHRLVALLLAFVLSLGLSQQPAFAQTAPEVDIQPYIDGVVNRITEFTLDNGMTFIVMERHQAPVVSFMTYVNIGSAYEQEGKTGAAHFLEHLAFKGTTQIGTLDYQAEQPLLDRLDTLFTQLQAAQTAGQTEEVVKLQEEFDTVKSEAAQYIKQNEFGQIVEQAGGVGLNATTSADATRYFYSFPSNKLELWMSLESERFLAPVFREFYEERDVILEERRARTDNSPIGKMIEVFLETALPGHPYGRPVIGYEADLLSLTRQDIQEFYEAHYTPDNIIIGIVGDVDPNQVKEFAEAYFGRYQARSSAPEIEATAPTQTEPNEIVLELPSEPWYLEGYQRPAITAPDNAVYQMIASLLVGGRTSRLYKSMIEQQLALNVDVSNSFPGDRYSNLMLLYALTAPNHTIEEVATALDTEIQRLKTEPVSAEELDRVKTQTRASLLQALASNQGMASLLPEYEAKTGSWRNLFEELKEIDAVTAEDVQRVAQELFQPQNLTIGKLLTAN